MSEVNVAIDVGKHQLEVALGSEGELFATPNEPGAIARLCQRLAASGCERVLLEAGPIRTCWWPGCVGQSCRW